MPRNTTCTEPHCHVGQHCSSNAPPTVEKALQILSYYTIHSMQGQPAASSQQVHGCNWFPIYPGGANERLQLALIMTQAQAHPELTRAATQAIVMQNMRSGAWLPGDAAVHHLLGVLVPGREGDGGAAKQHLDTDGALGGVWAGWALDVQLANQFDARVVSPLLVLVIHVPAVGKALYWLQLQAGLNIE